MTNVEFLEKIRQYFNTTIFELKETEHELDVLILTNEQKSYNFYLWVESNWTTMNIGASLKSDPEKYIWYQSWETTVENDHKWKLQLLEYSIEVLEKLLHHDTRIIQRKGLLTSSFECQYLTDSWNRVSKNNVLHSNIELPHIHGREKIYI